MQFSTEFNGQITNDALVKSPKQVRHATARKTTVTDCVVATPFHYSRENVEELVISHTTFCEDFSLTSLAGNKIVIIENCIFHKPVQLNCIKNIKMIIRNCHFKDSLKIVNMESAMLEIYGTTHNQDTILCNVKLETLYTSNMHMRKEHMLRLLNADVDNYLSM